MDDSKGMYFIIWRYRVRSGCDDAFRAAYGPVGDWVALFGRSAGYGGTTLVAIDTPGEYLTVDRWAAERSFHRFLRQHRPAYDALDQRLAPLTDAEELIGRGSAWDADDQNARPAE